MATLRRLIPLAGVLLAGFLHTAPAMASTTQAAMIQDDILVKTNPLAALAQMRSLGATRVRVGMEWDSVETSKGHYDFSLYNAIDQAAAADKISIYFMLTGPAPRWQTGSHADRGVAAGTWKPSTRGFAAFVKAAGTHFNGHHGVPRINFWSIWNEANYGQSLSPQTTDHNTVLTGAALYRGLVDAGWSALAATGHRHDTILIGETAPRGVSDPGDFLGIKPLSFLRALYCVSGSYQPLRGSAARAIGCPTTSSGTHRFRANNPALFSASGFAAHLYALQAQPGPPNRPTTVTGNSAHSDPNFADLPQVPALVGTLDRLNRVYGSHTRFPIWNTEYGYRTRPPDKVGIPQSLAAEYLNWAEYISYRQPRLADSMQYLLADPASGIFASGLESPTGKPKATLAAYRMPLYLPSTSTRKGRSLEVWGDVRPAPINAQATKRAQKVAIQWRKGSRGRWVTVATLTIRNRAGYIDTHVRFAGSGAVRLDWSPTPGGNYYSRSVNISVR